MWKNLCVGVISAGVMGMVGASCGGGVKNICVDRNIRCSSPLICDPGDGVSYSATNWSRIDYAGGGLFSREEDIYNLENFATLLTDWQTARDAANQP